MVICARHWPEGFKSRVVKGGISVPINPPSIFPDVELSTIPTAAAEPRPTKRARTDVRNPPIDEIHEFLETDTIDFDYFEIPANVIAEEVDCIYYTNATTRVFHSKLSTGPIFEWSLFVSDTGEIACYHKLEVVNIPFVGNEVKFWSHIQESLRFLRQFSSDEQSLRSCRFTFLYRQVELLNNKLGQNGAFSKEDFVAAFTIFTCSRSAYENCLNYIRLPCVRLLQEMTSRCDKVPVEHVLRQVPTHGLSTDYLIQELSEVLMPFENTFFSKILTYLPFSQKIISYF